MKYIVTLLLYFVFSQVYAGDVVSTISRLGAANQQYALVVVDVAIPTKPPYAEEYKVLSFDKSTAHGQDMYALALTALTADKKTND